MPSMDFLKYKTKRRIIDGIITKQGVIETMLLGNEPHDEILKEYYKVDALITELIKRIK
jgi:hypothetical protein